MAPKNWRIKQQKVYKQDVWVSSIYHLIPNEEGREHEIACSMSDDGKFAHSCWCGATQDVVEGQAQKLMIHHRPVGTPMPVEGGLTTYLGAR